MSDKDRDRVIIGVGQAKSWQKGPTPLIAGGATLLLALLITLVFFTAADKARTHAPLTTTAVSQPTLDPALVVIPAPGQLSYGDHETLPFAFTLNGDPTACPVRKAHPF